MYVRLRRICVRLSVYFLILLSTFKLFGAIRTNFPKNKPKLVVVLVLDQFRADYLVRYRERFIAAEKNGKLGGFNFLLEKGASFPQAHFNVLQNMTGPGHATLLTGAYPYMTGIPINEWFDSEKEDLVYCAEDKKHGWISNPGAKHVGTSPYNLIGTTLGDELRNLNSKSQVVSISLKDRSAILMGGRRAQTVIWMDPIKNQWTSTRYYYPEGKLPDWVETINQNLKTNEGGLARLTTLAAPLLGQIGFFPKEMKIGEKTVLASPLGLEMTEVIVERAVSQLKLGARPETDLLLVSFSSHDYAGHTYGPDNQAMQEITVADDLVLSRLFNYLNQHVSGGIKNVAIVLTADHGVAPNPELAARNRLDAGRLDEELIFSRAQKKMEERFGAAKGNWLLKVKELNFYLNPKALAEKEVEAELAQNYLKEVLRTETGVLHVFSLSDYRKRTLPPGIFEKQIMNSYFPGRSGDVVAILKPYFISGDET